MTTKQNVFKDLSEEMREAIENDDERAFLVAQKKLLLAGVSAAVNHFSNPDKNRKKIKNAPKHMHDILLGVLSAIVMADREIPDSWKEIEDET